MQEKFLMSFCNGGSIFLNGHVKNLGGNTFAAQSTNSKKGITRFSSASQKT